MKLNIKYSLEKDLWNYTRFLRSTGYAYGVSDKNESIIKRLSNEAQEIFHSSESDEIKSEKLLKYLQQNYEVKKSDIGESVQRLENTWKEIGDQIIYSLENFYNQKFPFDEVTAFITTNMICPYNYEERYFFVQKSALTVQLNTVMHELSHFMFYYYYPKLKEKLGKDEYELLKESLTFFTNPAQPGYPDEEKLRKLYMSKKWKNVDEIVKAAVKLLG